MASAPYGERVTDSALLSVLRAIAAGDQAAVRRSLSGSPQLARDCLESAATRTHSQDFFLNDIQHYVYQGDTALHVAAAAYRVDLVPDLIGRGADVRAKNRRGAEPLHYAADSHPGSRNWDPDAQAATIVALIDAGAEPNAVDKSGVSPLLRAVRTRGAAAVAALLEHGADPGQPNRRGHTPMELATGTSGRGGSGSPEAKAQQTQILRLLSDAL